MATFLSKVSQPSPKSGARSRLIDEWLVRFAVDCSEPVDPARIALWEDAFRDVPLEQLETAFKKTVDTHHFQGFPKVSDIRKHIDEAQHSALELTAAEKWEDVLAASNADRGFNNFDAVTQCAARAAGNLSRIGTYEDLEWAKKRFLERFILLHETGQAENLLSDSEREFVHQLIAKPEQPTPTVLTIAVAPADTPSPEDRADFARKFQELKDQIGIKPAEVSAPATTPVLTDAQFEARKEILKHQSAEIPPSPNEQKRPTLLNFPAGTPYGPGVDIALRAGAGGVSLRCRRCGYEELITAAESGLDRSLLARQAAFDHCWLQHRVGAWLVRFQDVRA